MLGTTIAKTLLVLLNLVIYSWLSTAALREQQSLCQSVRTSDHRRDQGDVIADVFVRQP